jgi:hypothetical protein
VGCVRTSVDGNRRRENIWHETLRDRGRSMTAMSPIEKVATASRAEDYPGLD